MIIDILRAEGPVVFPTGRHPDDPNKYVGWAVCEMILHPKEKQLEIKVWEIFIRPQYRQRGYASELLKGIVDGYNSELADDERLKVWTNYEEIDDYGARAFLNAGFKSVKSLNKTENNRLIWQNHERVE